MSALRRASVAAVTLATALSACHLDDLLSGPRQSPDPAGPDGAAPGDRLPGPATRLVFTIQPSDAASNAPLTSAVEVSAFDRDGTLATGFTGTVTLSLAANPSDGTLGGRTTRDAVRGVATFADLSIDRPGRDYTLRAGGSGLAAATSAPFDVGADPGSGDEIALESVSGNTQTGTVGAALDEPFVVRVVDVEGNGVAGVTVAWAVTGGGGTISPAASITDGDGRAASTRTLGTIAGTQTASATIESIPGFPVTFTATAAPGAPTALIFSVQPQETRAGETIVPAVEITLRDQFDNVATNFTGSVGLSIVPATGTPGATLSGTSTRSVMNGRATFDDLRIDLPGLGYRLQAGGAGRSADSSPFDIVL